jgi:hypothetical protein
MISSTFTEFHGKVFYEILENRNVKEQDSNADEINKISSSYKHLIQLSQEDFADKVFLDINKNTKRIPIDFRINSKKVININNFLNIQKPVFNNSKLFDPEKVLSPAENLANNYELLDYKLDNSNGNKIISKAYKYLLNYSKDPSTILLIKENEIPRDVLNLFDLLSKQVLNSSEIKKDNISTLFFYEHLISKLPAPTIFKHLILLYIVFQIIIPYHFDIYQTTTFFDCFL